MLVAHIWLAADRYMLPSRSVSEKELFSESGGHQMGSRGDLSVSGSDKDGGHIGVQVTEREAASDIEVEITTSEDGSQATLHLRLPLDCAPAAAEAEPAGQPLLGYDQEEQAEAASVQSAFQSAVRFFSPIFHMIGSCISVTPKHFAGRRG